MAITATHGGTTTTGMLLNSMGSLYSTHMLIETLNLSIVVYVIALAYQSVCTPSKVLYSLNLYVEMVWLLVPTGVVVAMMARVVIIQAAEEDVCHHVPLPACLLSTNTTSTYITHAQYTILYRWHVACMYVCSVCSTCCIGSIPWAAPAVRTYLIPSIHPEGAVCSNTMVCNTSSNNT